MPDQTIVRSPRHLQFESLADNLPILSWMADASGYMKWHSRRWYEYTGATPRELERWGWRSVHDPATRDAVNARWTACMATGQPFEMAFPLRSASGEFRPFLTHAHPYRDDSGVLTGWFGDNIEISPPTAEDELSRVNLELRTMAADARYLASIVESSNDAIVGKGLDGTIKSWNKAAETIFGYRAEEVIGRNIALLFPPDRLGEEAEIIDRIRRGERVGHHETERRHKDGSEIPVSLTVSPIHDANGVIVGASKSLRDISERREAQRALARSESEFRASFEGAAVGKVLAEAMSRRVLRANLALANMLGYAPDDLVGRTFSDFTWPEDPVEDERRYAQLLIDGSNAHVSEQRCVRRDGTPLWVRVSATLAKVPQSRQPSLVVIAVEDIDARHRAQAELLEAKRDLEKLVEERTAALEQRNLLLREVYHRVKNNLQIVDGLLMIQASKIDDLHVKDVVLGIRGRIFALGLVHQQLMGSSDLKTFDIAPFLQQLLKNIVEGGMSESIAISVSAHALIVGLDFAIPLGLLVTELVTNAMKHAFPDGIGKVMVSLEPDTVGALALIVSDDGVGMRATEADKVGKKGLGAVIVKSLVAQLQGTMVVRDDAGTTIEIRMPLPEAS